MNAQKFENEGKKVWTWPMLAWTWAHESAVNAQKSERESKTVWRTHESLELNARNSVHEDTQIRWTLEVLNKNARKSEFELKKIWWTHEFQDLNARNSDHEPTRVWPWTHESLDTK